MFNSLLSTSSWILFFWRSLKTEQCLNIINIISTQIRMGRWKIEDCSWVFCDNCRILSEEWSGTPIIFMDGAGGEVPTWPFNPSAPTSLAFLEHFLLLLSLCFCVSFSLYAPLNTLLTGMTLNRKGRHNQCQNIVGNPPWTLTVVPLSNSPETLWMAFHSPITEQTTMLRRTR